jgi:hypothetical protein
MTTNPPYSCCVSGCSETRVFTSYVSHLLSHKLSEFSEPTRKNIEGGVKGELISLCPPKISKVPNHKAYQCCFGCKKMYARRILQGEHKRECKNKDAHKEACKGMLDTVSTTQEAEPQGIPCAPADEKELIKLQKKIVALETTIEMNEKIVSDAEFKSEKAEMFLAGLNYSIRYMKGDQKEVYESFLPNFKEEHKELLKFVEL